MLVVFQGCARNRPCSLDWFNRSNSSEETSEKRNNRSFVVEDGRQARYPKRVARPASALTKGDLSGEDRNVGLRLAEKGSMRTGVIIAGLSELVRDERCPVGSGDARRGTTATATFVSLLTGKLGAIVSCENGLGREAPKPLARSASSRSAAGFGSTVGCCTVRFVIRGTCILRTGTRVQGEKGANAEAPAKV